MFNLNMQMQSISLVLVNISLVVVHIFWETLLQMYIHRIVGNLKWMEYQEIQKGRNFENPKYYKKDSGPWKN
jgi:hypothetical protein